MAISDSNKPGEYKVSEEEKRILEERLKDNDRKKARPAADVMRDLRQNYKPSHR